MQQAEVHYQRHEVERSRRTVLVLTGQSADNAALIEALKSLGDVGGDLVDR